MITVMLIGWPLLTLILARTVPWPNAIVASLIGGYLLLPEQGGLDLPLLPPLEKDTIPCLTLFFLALVMRPGEAAVTRPSGQAGGAPTINAFDTRKGWLPKSTTGLLCLLALIAGALMTAATNSDPLRFAQTSFTIRGLELYDGFSIIVTSASVIVPILLGRKYLADPRAHRVLLIALVVAGLGYSLLALAEVRLSPQLNRWVYGFFPHSWHQHIRGGGYRPLVFLQHGLLLAIFFAMTILAAIGLFRAESRARGRWLLAAGWLLVTLILSNSLGAALIAMALLPVLLLLNVRLQLLVAGIIAGIVLFYPLVRGAGLVPTTQIVSFVNSYNPDRSRSLGTRFRNEDALIERANERPLFGWGPVGRNRVYDDFGRDQSIVDGAWIVAIGQGGWLRYAGEFGLLGVPLILFAIRRRRYDIDPVTAALCLVLAANMIDMIPNSGRSPLTWLIVGALLGRLELGVLRHASAGATSEATSEAPDMDHSGLALASNPLSPYTRQSVQHQRSRSVPKP